MRRPSPLPERLPEGTTALNGKWVLRGEAYLKEFSISTTGYKGAWLRQGSSAAQLLIMEIGEVDWTEEDLRSTERRA